MLIVQIVGVDQYGQKIAGPGVEIVEVLLNAVFLHKCANIKS